jgi:purine nucleoside phosphorylase
VSGRLAIVGGNTLIGSDIGADAPELTVDDGTTAVVVRDLGDAYLLQRHGYDPYTPPHLVDHGANLRALRALECDRMLALNS